MGGLGTQSGTRPDTGVPRQRGGREVAPPRTGAQRCRKGSTGVGVHRVGPTVSSPAEAERPGEGEGEDRGVERPDSKEATRGLRTGVSPATGVACNLTVATTVGVGGRRGDRRDLEAPPTTSALLLTECSPEGVWPTSLLCTGLTFRGNSLVPHRGHVILC